MLNGFWNPREALRRLIAAKGGFCNCHAHLDRAFSITEKDFEMSQNSLREKWQLTDALKKESRYADTLLDRMQLFVETMIEQGVSVCRAYVDVDSTIRTNALDAALHVQKMYQGRFLLQIAASPIKGLSTFAERQWFEKGCELADVVGGLPSKDCDGFSDIKNLRKNLEFIFDLARGLGKPIDAQIDQINIPQEQETEYFAAEAIRARGKGYEKSIAAIHTVSLSKQSENKRKEIISLLKEADIGVIVCPRAALSMKQISYYSAPICNSIAPVQELVEAGVTVGLGTDNVHDIYMPFSDGDIYGETLVLADACRLYNLDYLSEIASGGGRKILGWQ